MLNMLPTPSLADLLYAFFRAPSFDGELIAGPWRRRGDAVHWLSRSAWSLRAISEWHRSFHPDRPVRFWVPDFFCSQSLAGLRGEATALQFYPIDENLRPNWKECRILAKSGPPDVFLVVHYHGLPADVKGATEFCGQHRAVLAEDCAHVLLPSDGIGGSGDFALFSPHKHLAIPDGALLLARPKVMRKVGGKDGEFDASFRAALESLPTGSTSSLRWMIRRLLVRFLPDGIGSDGCQPPPVYGEAAAGPPGLAVPSRLSEKLLSRYVSDIESTGWRRFINAAVLAKAIGDEGVELVQPEMNAGFPYTLCVHYTDAEAAERGRSKIRKSGCPITMWPDLPPEIVDRPGVAEEVRNRRVFLPVHQDLSIRRYVGRLGRGGVLARPDLPGARLDWDLPTAEWRDAFSAAPCSHLVQSSAYVAARTEGTKWWPRYGAIEVEGRRCAVFSVMERRFAGGLVTAGRMNRGPIWTTDDLSSAQRLAGFSAIVRHYRWQSGRILASAPNLEMNPDVVVALMALGMRRRSSRPWSSVWMDLNADEETLLARLDGKWRNQLRAAEKKGMQIESSDSDEAFDWMLERHSELMQQRDFSGPPPDLVRRLRDECDNIGHRFHTFRAMMESEPVAGITVVRHGTSATYLLGWNGPMGRKANANNLLLWSAVRLLKSEGCRWFDLGGIDPWNMPGITEFKRGTRGREYRLVGEYLGWKGK